MEILNGFENSSILQETDRQTDVLTDRQQADRQNHSEAVIYFTWKGRATTNIIQTAFEIQQLKTYNTFYEM